MLFGFVFFALKINVHVHLDVCARVLFWAKTFLEVKQKHVLLKDMHCNSLCMLATF